MNEIRVIDGEEFGFHGVIITRQIDTHADAEMVLSWPQANKLQADLRKLLTEARVTLRDAF